MSTFKQKKELKSTIARMKAANEKKKGSFSPQQIGRVQYKLNQLTADPKGNAVRSKPKGKQKVGSVVKTGNGGVVRQKPKANLPKKKRIISKGIVDPKKTGGHPSARPTSKVASKATSKAANKKKLGLGITFVEKKPLNHSGYNRKSLVNNKINKLNIDPNIAPLLKEYTNAQLRILAKKGLFEAKKLLAQRTKK